MKSSLKYSYVNSGWWFINYFTALTKIDLHLNVHFRFNFHQI